MCRKHPQYARLTESVEHPLLPGITDTRLDRFFFSPYASQHLEQLLDRARYDSTEYVRMTYWSAPGDSKPGFDEALEALEAHGQPLSKGFEFGLSWTNHWVKVELTLPSALKAYNQPIIFEFDPSCEALIFLPDGTPLHAITGGSNSTKDNRPGNQEDRRVEHVIPSAAVEAGSYTLIIEVSCNAMFGLGNGGYKYQVPDANLTFRLANADVVVPNFEVHGLRNDFTILMQVARQPEGKVSGLSQRAMKACNDIMNTFRRVDGDEEDHSLVQGVVAACRGIAWQVLGQLDEEGLTKVMTRSTAPREAKIWAIGHCHIDTAWLWRYTQTQQKIARSWTTQCDIMDRWPNHQFAASSAQQYYWLEKLYPKGFGRVKQYVEKGRFHVVGGAWLEHDCMVPSGESLIRQYLYGQRYFRSRFGSYCREAWLPDTFGYASQLPQILRSAGLNYFFTQKMSWNNINTFPYNSFNWTGIDGTQVLAHMTPVDTYNAQAKFGEIIKGISNNKNLGVTDQCLLLFGNGDGGGGPTPNMLENLERLGSLSEHNPEVPSLKMGSPIDFFDDLCERTKGGKTLPTWRGELYFEFHRGTYTTQADLKKGNRQMETLLRDLEYLGTLASLLDSTYEYPKHALDEMWQDTMLGQFHDCLPGTTIRGAVDDNLEIYRTRGRQAHGLIDIALTALSAQQGNPNSDTIQYAIDPLRLVRNETIATAPGQFARLTSDSTGIGKVDWRPAGLEAPRAQQDGEKYTISNSRFSLTAFSGRITSLFDLSIGRELIAAGPGAENGGWVLHEDYPLTYDAWDVEIYHLQSYRTLLFDEVKLVEDPLRASLVATSRFGHSVATLTISLDAVDPSVTGLTGYPRLEAHVDWHERHKLLKFTLPVDIHSAYATYATQFGLVERPTHRNTTHDQAKFECCAHGFVDLSEATYGVALACGTKYGYSVEGNSMRISCLRSSTSPDPEADQGEHNFSFAIMPHRGQLGDSGVHVEALRHHNPPHLRTKAPRSDLPTFSTEGPGADGIILETIKRGEDDTADSKSVILRFYEARGGRAKGTFVVNGLQVRRAEWVNILEEPLSEEESCVSGVRDGTLRVDLDFRCFEIKTLKLDIA